MALLDRIFRDGEPRGARPSTGPGLISAMSPEVAAEYQELKFRVHNRLFEYIDFSRLSQISQERVMEDLSSLTRRILNEEDHPFTKVEREQLVVEIQNEVFGLGPLEPLLNDATVSDILVNGPKDVYVERSGVIEPTIIEFKDDDHLLRIIEKMLSTVGRRIDELTPYADARLADGSRVHAIIPPLALNGPTVSIRRFAADPLTHEDLVGFGTLSKDSAKVLEGIVRSRCNVLISGGTGCGKTTMLNVMSAFIPPTERIVTIEDSAELQLKQDHVVRLETRPPNVENKGRVTQRDLVINCLRMRPDRIVIGEVRGDEALDMLQAMNTGHDGSLTTIHANSPYDAVGRIETMVAMSGLDLPRRAIQQQVASAIDVVLQLTRFSDGSRRLMSLMEIQGIDKDKVVMKEIYRFHHRETDRNGRVHGELQPTGEKPKFLERFRLAGYELPDSLFDAPLTGGGI
jgi:pilus assembly protein CpaF